MDRQEGSIMVGIQQASLYCQGAGGGTEWKSHKIPGHAPAGIFEQEGIYQGRRSMGNTGLAGLQKLKKEVSIHDLLLYSVG